MCVPQRKPGQDDQLEQDGGGSGQGHDPIVVSEPVRNLFPKMKLRGELKEETRLKFD